MNIKQSKVALPLGGDSAALSSDRERSGSVIIVGAGPAGSATAFFLATAGVDVLLLDRARFPRDKPCAEYLSPQAARILAAMDALGDLEAGQHANLAGMAIRAPNGSRMRGDFASSHGFKGFRDCGLAVRRTILDAVLLERARRAGARVAEGLRVTDVIRSSSRVAGVTAMNAAGAQVRITSNLVIGADGLRSVVARRLALQRTMRWPRRLALVTHYRGVQSVGDCGEMHVERDGYAGFADVGGGETNVAVVVPSSEARAASGNRAAYMTAWLNRRPHLVERFQGSERSGPVLATGPFASHVARAWAPGAALVGDAADFFDPFTGEGIYAALRGGELLASAIAPAVSQANPGTIDNALRGYEAARRAEFGGKWMVEKMVGLAVGFPPLINHVAGVLGRRKDMADLLVGVTGDFVPAREVLRPRFLASLLLK